MLMESYLFRLQIYFYKYLLGILFFVPINGYTHTYITQVTNCIWSFYCVRIYVFFYWAYTYVLARPLTTFYIFKTWHIKKLIFDIVLVLRIYLPADHFIIYNLKSLLGISEKKSHRREYPIAYMRRRTYCVRSFACGDYVPGSEKSYREREIDIIITL